jgi:hypothetical protein
MGKKSRLFCITIRDQNALPEKPGRKENTILKRFVGNMETSLEKMPAPFSYLSKLLTLPVF